MSENKPPMKGEALAWLTKGYDLEQSEHQPARSRIRRGLSRQKIETEEQQKTDVSLVEESFVVLSAHGEALAARFYQRLYEHYPAVISLFSKSSLTEQQKKLTAALVLIVHNLRKPDVLGEYLKGLGARHATYGITAKHYPLVTETLLAVLEEFAGDAWTPAVKLAWQKTLNSIATIMLEAHKQVAVEKDVTNNKEFVIDQQKMNDLENQLVAINKVLSIISFAMDGTIIDVNQNFLDFVGYRRDEVINKHHRILVRVDLAISQQYTEFWARLNRGECVTGGFKYIAKDGKEVWLQSSYSPILDRSDKPYKVVNYASHITINRQQKILIEKGMTDTTGILNAISIGDLSQNLTGEYEDEFTTVQRVINETFFKLSQAVKNINETASDIVMAAKEVVQANIDLKQRTINEHSTLVETVSNIKHRSIISSQNTFSRITGLNTSKKVTEIVGVIDEIAFQTDLLSLNATLEAARVGKKGRGFAVIVSEIRNLAQQSAVAANEINTLMIDHDKKTKGSSLLLDESGKKSDEILLGTQEVAEIRRESAAANAEQSQVHKQINLALMQMDEMNLQNTAFVEKVTEACELLQEQRKVLQRLMTFFKTSNEVMTEHKIDSFSN